MNVDGLLKKYFAQSNIAPSIEVFDKDSIYSVYSDIVKLLNSYPDIELSILQALSYCFHSEKICGTVIMRYLPDNNLIQVLVADDGIGVQKSLSANPIYEFITEQDAVLSCINDRVQMVKGWDLDCILHQGLLKMLV